MTFTFYEEIVMFINNQDSALGLDLQEVHQEQSGKADFLSDLHLQP